MSGYGHRGVLFTLAGHELKTCRVKGSGGGFCPSPDFKLMELHIT